MQNDVGQAVDHAGKDMIPDDAADAIRLSVHESVIVCGKVAACQGKRG